jgi:hypothetical protein
MAPIEEFAKPRGWSITGWEVTGSGTIPRHTFMVGGTLLIGIVQGPTPACGLVWLDLNGQPCFIKDLRFQEGRLHAPDVSMSIGGVPVEGKVNLTIDAGGVLKGKLIGKERGGVDGNTGTFAADANPGG